MITPVTPAVHTVLLGGPSEATLHNHRWYCSARGYSHHSHAIFSPGNSARTLLTYKYSVVRKVLANAAAGALLIFADDTSAFYSALDSVAVIGEANHWVAESASTHLPETNLFMLRAGPSSLAMIDGVLDRLQQMPDAAMDRWNGLELDGWHTHAHDLKIDGRHFPNLLFTPFGHHLPELSAFALSFNPTAHANVHDARLATMFLQHLNETQRRGSRLFDGLWTPPPPPPPPPQPSHRQVHRQDNGGRTALVTAYTSSIAHYAIYSARNIDAYARRHGYAHHSYANWTAADERGMAANWIKASLLLHHLSDHDQVVWIDSDILIHDQRQTLADVSQGQSMTLARDISGHAFNSGFMMFSNTTANRDYLEGVQAKIDGVSDRSSVYASGGDQRFFIEAWQERGGTAFAPLSDCVSLNSHPALYDADTFMLHYMGYPDRFRALVMSEDARRIERLEY